MRFRRHKIAVCADVQKMFNQVKLNEEQWDCQRIFWRENPADQLKEYWLTVVTFGLASSPYLAVRCVQQAAIEAKGEYPEAAKIILEDFYMDDCVSGTDSIGKAIDLAKQIRKVLANAGFILRKWVSNEKTVLDALEQDNTESEEAMVFAEDGQTTILGLKWLFGKDQYTFVVKTPLFVGPATKRKIVSLVSQLYDPNGYIAPVIIIGEVIIQQLWRLELDWDETVDRILERD